MQDKKQETDRALSEVWVLPLTQRRMTGC